MSKYLSRSQKDTKQIAQDILREFWARERKGALVLALVGDLGAGKTNFTQGLAKFLGIQQTVSSPTFVLMKRYSINSKTSSDLGLDGLSNLYHFDAYRLNNSKEILDLGWEDVVSSRENLIVVEWAEKIQDILSSDAVRVDFKSYNENQREIEVN